MDLQQIQHFALFGVAALLAAKRSAAPDEIARMKPYSVALSVERIDDTANSGLGRKRASEKSYLQ